MSFADQQTNLARRRFGQNFLVDRHVVDRIISAVNPQSDETIIEIGPGRGALTKRLVEIGARIIAIEFDRDLAHACVMIFAITQTSFWLKPMHWKPTSAQ